MNFNVYKVTLPQSSKDLKLTPTDDLVELKWFDIKEIKNLKLTPPNIKLFTKLGYLEYSRSYDRKFKI